MKTLFLACTSMLALTAGVANATSSSAETREQVVSYADLDLEDGAGAAALMQRIRAAARVVCRTPGVEWTTLDAFLRAQRCRELAIEQAVERVGATSLTRLIDPSDATPGMSAATETVVRATFVESHDAASQTSLAARTVARYVRQSRK
jgi:UrcA family protein